MRIGVVLIPTDPWAETLAIAQRLDRLGFDHLWLYDHLTWRRYRDRPWHATYPWLAGLAVGTERIRLGTMVSNLNVRHPVTLAKDVMSVDHLSNGRMVLGLGAAGLGFDAEVLGRPVLSPGQRVQRLEEAADVLDRLLRDDDPDDPPVDHHGAWYTVVGARTLPGCVQRPRVPLAIAAGGRRSIDVAARRGDAWITYGDATAPAGDADSARLIAQQVEQLGERCAEHGRDAAELDRIFLSGNDGERITSSIEAFRDAVGRFGEAGITDLVIHHPRADDEIWNDPPEIIDEIAEAFLS